jgi:hypothetical protein
MAISPPPEPFLRPSWLAGLYSPGPVMGIAVLIHVFVNFGPFKGIFLHLLKKGIMGEIRDRILSPMALYSGIH